jgi:hypothetical protein
MTAMLNGMRIGNFETLSVGVKKIINNEAATTLLTTIRSDLDHLSITTDCGTQMNDRRASEDSNSSRMCFGVHGTGKTELEQRTSGYHFTRAEGWDDGRC